MATGASILFLIFSLLAPFIVNGSLSRTPALGLDFHHRYSDRVRTWAERMSWDVSSWPERSTVAYYSSLVQHDRAAIHGRGLADGPPDLTFADGNFTVRINSLGFLHYSIVSLGTPNVSFLVALDTGSDLFWVPCDCQSCASTSGDNYGFNNVNFNYFSSKASSTSKKILCNSSLCEKSSCSSPSDVCPYEVKYVSANTSSSGFLLEDILYLTTDDTQQKSIQTRVTFGCGQTQTGAFLRSGGFNGLFGLGRDKISVPSILANHGLTANSFSMCFGPDGSGRISFGDKGHTDQEITPINNDTERPTYDVSVSGMKVGNVSLNTSFNAIFDSGTSFTILADPAYTLFTQAFDSLVSFPRGPSIPELSIEYCYRSSSMEGFPNVKLTMNGGGGFPVLHPMIHVKVQGLLTSDDIYCLAVMKASRLNIIGQNFMTGLKVVFDREKLVLGWKEFDCYNVEDAEPLPVNPSYATSPPSSPSPPGAKGRREAVTSGVSYASMQQTFVLLCSLLLLVIHLH